MSQKLSLNGFESRKDNFKFDDEFIIDFNEDSDKEYIRSWY